MKNELVNEWLIWQLADSAFPSGGFAHSGGLESAWQHGVVNDGETLEKFLRTSLSQIKRGALHFTSAAWEEHAQFSQFDADCDLFLNNRIANQASRSQGKAFLGSSARTFKNKFLNSLNATIRKQQMPGHFAPVFGVVMRELKISRPRTSSLLLYISLRGFLSSAVRLGIIGPIEAQTIQAAIAESDVLAEDEISVNAVQTTPFLDLLQGTQERLYCRLFQS